MGVAAKIGDIAKERKISLKELSRMVDIPYTTLYHAVKRDSKIDFETAKRIADALSIDVNWLLNGFTLEEHDDAFIRRLQHKEPLSERELYLLKHPNDEPAPERPDVAQMIDGLTEENVKQLMDYADFLKSRQAPQDAPAGIDDKEPAEK